MVGRILGKMDNFPHSIGNELVKLKIGIGMECADLYA